MSVHPLHEVKVLTAVTVILTKASWNQVLPRSTAVESVRANQERTKTKEHLLLLYQQQPC